MHVDSYLEVFTTMYGWAFANIISSIIIGTGLVVVLFFVIIFKKWLDAKEQGMQACGIMSLLESAQTRLIIALFVATLCFFGSPTTSLKDVDIIFQPIGTYTVPSAAQPTASRNTGTGTAYDTPMADANNLESTFKGLDGLDRVPLWWYSVMAISSGINHAVRDGFKSLNENISLRQLQARALVAGIKSTPLRNEVSKFINFCHGAALAKFAQIKVENLSATGQAIIKANPNDIATPYSSLFMTEPGFYDSIQCYQCSSTVSRYSNDAARDTQPATTSSALGMPMCKEWWTDIARSIVDDNENNKLLAAAVDQARTNNYMAGFTLAMEGQILGGNSSTKEIAEGITVQAALSNANTQFFDYSNFYGIDNNSQFLTQVVGGLGALENKLKSAVLYSVLTSALPMVQALLLMGIYAFLPLVIFLSGFDLRAMFIGAVALFTVKLFAAMWMVAIWMETKLVDAM